MSALQRAIEALESADRAVPHRGALVRVDARCVVAVSLAYLVVMLSVSVVEVGRIILFGLYPVLFAAAADVPWGRIMRRAVVLLPVVLLFGAANLIYDREPLFMAEGVTLTRGVVSTVSLLLRALWSFAVVTVMVEWLGMGLLCRTLRRLGLPVMMATQLLMLHRYLHLVLVEAQSMLRARDARSFGRRGYPLRLWAAIVATLFARTVLRGERLHRAMTARGFRGEMPPPRDESRWQWRESVVLVAALAIFLFLRFL